MPATHHKASIKNLNKTKSLQPGIPPMGTYLTEHNWEYTPVMDGQLFPFCPLKISQEGKFRNLRTQLANW